MDVPDPARNLVNHLGAIVSALTSQRPGGLRQTSVRCRRRPGRRPCAGQIWAVIEIGSDGSRGSARRVATTGSSTSGRGRPGTRRRRDRGRARPGDRAMVAGRGRPHRAGDVCTHDAGSRGGCGHLPEHDATRGDPAARRHRRDPAGTPCRPSSSTRSSRNALPPVVIDAIQQERPAARRRRDPAGTPCRPSSSTRSSRNAWRSLPVSGANRTRGSRSSTSGYAWPTSAGRSS